MRIAGLRALVVAIVSEETLTVWLDNALLLLGGFVAIAFLLILQPMAKPEAAGRQPGSIIVEIRWPDALNIDVDLWVRAPADRPVGYSNKSGRVFDLLRDDVGQANDTLQLNYENAYTRGVVAGEYVINLHLYNANSEPLPVPVAVQVSQQPASGGSVAPLWSGAVSLDHYGQELTVIRFSMDEHGALVPGSFGTLQVLLRGALP